MKIIFSKKEGSVAYSYEYVPTPLGDEEEKVQVESFAKDTAKYYMSNDDQLGGVRV